MKTTCLISLLGVGMLSAIVGCSNDDSNATSGASAIVAAPSATPTPSASANPSSGTTPSAATTVTVTATVAKQTLTATATQCTVDVDYPAVTVQDAAVTAAIAKILVPPTTADLCQTVDTSNPDQTLDVAGSFTTQANSNGILSVTSHSELTFTPSTHPEAEFVTYDFDLTTGKQLGLTDVLTADGLGVVKAACVAALSEALDPDIASIDCTATLQTGPNSGFGFFEIEDSGFHMMLDLPFAFSQLGLTGALIPWKDLAGKLTPGLVANFAQAHSS